MKYVLVTAARNEEAYIESTIQSVLMQTVLPAKWVIVSDGSTDETENIVKRYLSNHSWIELLILPPRGQRSFTGKAHAFNEGANLLFGFDYDVIGNLDADVSFEPDYFEYLLEKFKNDDELGVAGTHYIEDGFHSYKDSYINEEHVNGAVQIFRKACFDELNGYVESHIGGIDWIAVTTARMNGWKTRSFPGRVFNHLRKIGTEGSTIYGSKFTYGKKDYLFGGHPLWIILRSFYQMSKKPYIFSGLYLLSGYIWAWLSNIETPVSSELRYFHRKEQINRLKFLFKNKFSTNRSL